MTFQIMECFVQTLNKLDEITVIFIKIRATIMKEFECLWFAVTIKKPCLRKLQRSIQTILENTFSMSALFFMQCFVCSKSLHVFECCDVDGLAFTPIHVYTQKNFFTSFLTRNMKHYSAMESRKKQLYYTC